MLKNEFRSGSTQVCLAGRRLDERLRRTGTHADTFLSAAPLAGSNFSSLLATFERDLVSSRSPFDRWVEGDEAALSAAERRGLDVFVGPAHCASCHVGWNFTDGQYHDTGLPSLDIGRAGIVPADPLARYAFKTPSLGDTGRRAPYMHDGSLPTLEAVVQFYESGWATRPSLSPLMQRLQLSATQRGDLVAFLRTLTGPPKEFAVPTLPR